MTFDELIAGYSGQLDISQEWKTFWMTANCMVCLPSIYGETILIEKSEFVPSHHVLTQWLLMNTQVPAQGIDVYASINSYELDRGRVSPGAAALLSNAGGHRPVAMAFVVGSYFWYHSFTSF